MKNTLIENNTVAHCTGAGIHVDHTMVLTGNQIKNNVLFNNKYQLSMSDWSNYNTPGASPPYYVPSFNTVYSGNVMYCLNRDQLCLFQMHCWSGTPVDFGTFSDNFYFNPYNEVSIYQQINPSSQRKYYHLERWQNELGLDAGSSRSPLHLDKYAVTNVFGANMVNNSTFDYNTNSWFGWPTQGQISHDAAQLDNGSLKVQFSDNTTYNSFLLQQSDQHAVQNGEWYRLKFSYKGGVIGELKAEFKGQTQQVGPQSIISRLLPLDSERREAELIFQSDLTDQAYIQLVNSYIHPTYWLDNVELHRVQVQAQDPMDRHQFLYNPSSSPVDFNLTGCWSDVQGQLHYGSITIAPYSSAILILEDDLLCGLSTGVEESTNMQRSLVYPNPTRPGNEIFFEEALSTNTTLNLLDAQGRTVQSVRMNSGARSFVLNSDLSAGSYVLTDLSGSMPQARIIVQ